LDQIRPNIKIYKEAPLSDFEPIAFRPRSAGTATGSGSGNVQTKRTAVVAFNRAELSDILSVYGRHVAQGDWRDYALDMTSDKAVFSIFHKSSEVPIYRVEKSPKLARRQGAYSVIAATGLILKRGQDLRRVLSVLEKKLRVV